MITVIGYVDSKCYIDPLIADITSHWKLWVLGKQPLFWLASDPTDYQWTHPFTSNNFYLFSNIVYSWEDTFCWIDGMCYQLHFNTGVRRLFIPKFHAKLWVSVWARKRSQQVLHVQWLLVHRALSVNKWMHKMGVSSSCANCHLQVEALKYCQWGRIESQLVWQRHFRILAIYFPLSIFTWGMVVWISLVHFIFHYDVKSMDHGFHTKYGSVRVLPLVPL